MHFRPCIDIHNGKVKQIVGSTLNDAGNSAQNNFVSDYDASYYGQLYKEHGLPGGHVIILNKPDSEYYEETVRQARSALSAFPGGLQLGGGINPQNAVSFLDAGASHVIVTSYVFRDGAVDEKRLCEMVSETGRERLVLDLSCKKQEDGYYITTDRWQKITDVRLDKDSLTYFAGFCDEILVHAVDVEGKRSGIDRELCEMLGTFTKVPITYAGGISCLADIKLLWEYAQGRLDFTIGSALDIFGGPLKMEEVERTLIEIQ